MSPDVALDPATLDAGITYVTPTNRLPSVFARAIAAALRYAVCSTLGCVTRPVEALRYVGVLGYKQAQWDKNVTHGNKNSHQSTITAHELLIV